MKDVNQSRLATTLALLIGLWVAISPSWIPMSSSAQVSTFVVGIIMVVASIVQYFTKSVVPSWITGIAAAWLFLSVFIYGMSAGAAWSSILSAIAVIALSVWDAVEVDHFAHRRPIATM